MNIFVMATHYEGEPPDDAVEWNDWLTETSKSAVPEYKDNKFALQTLVHWNN